MIEWLKLCGFTEDNIESELPRVQKVFSKLGINAEDIERGKQRLLKYYDMELKGVRKILRLCLQELVNLVLAREEGKSKIIYGFTAPGFSRFCSALVAKSKEVYVASLCQQFQLVLGCIFDKMVPVLEAAEVRWLKSGAVGHCGNLKALVGLFALELIPKPDLMVTSGFLCDTAPKTVDLLHELYEIPTCCYDICQDRESRGYPDATKRIVNFAAKSIRRFAERVQKVVGFEITDDMLRETLDARGGLDGALRNLEELIENSDPLPISANHQILWICLDSIPLNIDSLPDAIDAVNTLYEELQERVNKGLGVVDKGAPRILALLPTHYTDPRLDFLVGKLGMAIVSTDSLFAYNLGESEDPYEIISLAAFQRSFCTSLPKRIPLLIEGCKRLSVNGVLDRFHVGCRSVAADALMIKNAITNELGIPVVLLERDDFDPRVYNHEQYKRRLETFKTTLIK